MAELVASVMARHPGAAIRAGRQAGILGADWLELRLDEWPAAEPLRPVIDAVGLPVLACCRTVRDGGRFRGTDRERIELLEAAINAGAEGLDLEDWETWTPPGDAVRMMVRSHHDLRRVPEELPALRDHLLDLGADVAKVVGMAHDLGDAAPLMALMAAADRVAEPTVAFAMGRSASVTRLLSVAMGAPLVYASVPGGEATAIGQIDLDVVAGIYRGRRIDATTEIFGLVGQPIGRSVGPWLHNRVLAARGRDAVYLPLETSRLRSALALLPVRRRGGLSVTAPLKEEAVTVCHRLDDDAIACGAVNTLTFEAHGSIVGHNTDVAGVLGALRSAGVGEVGGRHGVVLGGGGAARAAAVALERLGMRVTILARSLEPVREFARRRGYRLAALRSELLRDDPPLVTVHATPLGGLDQPDQTILADWVPPAGSFVLDAVYRPARTRLLERATAAGAVSIGGLEWFLTQAAEQLRLFLGERPPEDELRRYLAGLR